MPSFFGWGRKNTDEEKAAQKRSCDAAAADIEKDKEKGIDDKKIDESIFYSTPLSPVEQKIELQLSGSPGGSVRVDIEKKIAVLPTLLKKEEDRDTASIAHDLSPGIPYGTGAEDDTQQEKIPRRAKGLRPRKLSIQDSDTKISHDSSIPPSEQASEANSDIINASPEELTMDKIYDLSITSSQENEQGEGIDAIYDSNDSASSSVIDESSTFSDSILLHADSILLSSSDDSVDADKKVDNVDTVDEFASVCESKGNDHESLSTPAMKLIDVLTVPERSASEGELLQTPSEKLMQELLNCSIVERDGEEHNSTDLVKSLDIGGTDSTSIKEMRDPTYSLAETQTQVTKAQHNQSCIEKYQATSRTNENPYADQQVVEVIDNNVTMDDGDGAVQIEDLGTSRECIQGNSQDCVNQGNLKTYHNSEDQLSKIEETEEKVIDRREFQIRDTEDTEYIPMSEISKCQQDIAEKHKEKIVTPVHEEEGEGRSNVLGNDENQIQLSHDDNRPYPPSSPESVSCDSRDDQRKVCAYLERSEINIMNKDYNKKDDKDNNDATSDRPPRSFNPLAG
eukprot:scaffold4023_cov183-Chaetoceros_neogracile.AAC.1